MTHPNDSIRGLDQKILSETEMSRRRFVVAAVGIAAAVLASPPSISRADDDGIVGLIKRSAATDPIVVQKLRGNINVLQGSGGNIAVLPGRDGKLLIEAGIAVSQPRIVEALAGISPDPIAHLVNTHWHFDHTDGNNWLHAAGADHHRAREHA